MHNNIIALIICFKQVKCGDKSITLNEYDTSIAN